MEHLLVVLGTFAFCLGSAMIPVLHAEAYLVGASLLAPPELRWPLVIAATIGQMIGKVGMYYAGRGALLIPGQRMQRRIQQATAKYREKGQVGSALVFVSASTGFPPEPSPHYDVRAPVPYPRVNRLAPPLGESSWSQETWTRPTPSASPTATS